MELIIYDKFKNKFSWIDHTKHNIPIPRIGERVNMGYNPAPKVINVLYDFKNKQIFIALD